MLWTNLWRCTCATATERKLDWYGKTSEHAEWRRKTTAILISRFLDQFDNSNNSRNDRKEVCIIIFTRADKGLKKFVQTPFKGPTWDDVVRRVTFDLDATKIIQYVQVKDQTTGYDWLGL